MHTYSSKLILRRLLLLPASQYEYTRLLRSNMLLLMCAFVSFQRGPTLGVLQASEATSKAAVFQVSKLFSSLSRIQTLRQYFMTYPNIAAIFHLSKPCSSLSRNAVSKPCNTLAVFHHVSKPCSSLSSRIQILQQSFRYSNLAAVSSGIQTLPTYSSLEYVP